MVAVGDNPYVKLGSESSEGAESESSEGAESKSPVEVVVDKNVSSTPYVPHAENQVLIPALLNHVTTEHPRSICYRFGQYFILAFASGGCTWLYVEPSLEYSKENKLDGVNTALTVIGNTLPSALVMGNVVSIYWSLVAGRRDFRQALPEEFRNPRKMAQDSNAIPILAVISALPLLFPVFQSSEELPFWAQVIKGGITLGVYSANHMLAIEIIFFNKLTRTILLIPGLIFYYPFYKWPSQCNLSDKEKYDALLTEQTEKDQNQLFALFNQQYQRSITAILGQIFKRRQTWNPLQWGYELNVPAEIHAAINDPDKFQGHIKLIQYGMSLLAPRPPVPESTSFFNRCLNRVKAAASSCAQKAAPVLSLTNSVLQYVTYGLGGTVSAVGTAGFCMSGVNFFNDKIHNEGASWALNAPPIFATAVLSGKFGGDLWEGVYNNLIAGIKGELEIPLAMKFYPKTVLSLIAITGVLSWFSPQTAMWLVQKNFADPKYDDVRDFLVKCAEYGIAGYSFIHQFEVILGGGELYAFTKGTPDQKTAVQLKFYGQRMSQSATSINLGKFENELKKMNPELRETVLAISEAEFEKITNHDENLQENLRAQSKKVRGCRSCFLPAPREIKDASASESKNTEQEKHSPREGINSGDLPVTQKP